jgi:hypothetical protein
MTKKRGGAYPASLAFLPFFWMSGLSFSLFREANPWEGFNKLHHFNNSLHYQN